MEKGRIHSKHYINVGFLLFKLGDHGGFCGGCIKSESSKMGRIRTYRNGEGGILEDRAVHGKAPNSKGQVWKTTREPNKGEWREMNLERKVCGWIMESLEFKAKALDFVL